MLTRLLKSMASKPEKTDVKHLQNYAKNLKKGSAMWRKAKKAAEKQGLADVDTYFRKDFSTLLDKHAKVYEQVVEVLKPAKAERDAKAVQAGNDKLKTAVGKLSPVLDLYVSMLSGGLTSKTRAINKEHGKSGGKAVPQDAELEQAIGTLNAVLVWDIKEDICKALGGIAPYLRAA